jgi:hypothetical protein
VALDGPAGAVLADPRLAAMRVAPPASVRMRRAAEAGNLGESARARLGAALDAALDAAALRGGAA